MDVTNDLGGEAERLMTDGLGWLRATYPEHRIVVERDLVWTLQKWLACEVSSRELPLRVFNDYGVEPGLRRSLSADLVLLPVDQTSLLAVAKSRRPRQRQRRAAEVNKSESGPWAGGQDAEGRQIRCTRMLHGSPGRGTGVGSFARPLACLELVLGPSPEPVGIRLEASPREARNG